MFICGGAAPEFKVERFGLGLHIPFHIVVSGPLFGLYNGVYLRLFFLGNVQGGVGFSVLALFL